MNLNKCDLRFLTLITIIMNKYKDPIMNINIDKLKQILLKIVKFLYYFLL